MATVEETYKISKDTRFAVLGRAVADAALAGQSTLRLIEELEQLRHHEQDSADRETRFAAFARQLGDAARTDKDTTTLINRLRALRRHELTGQPIPPQ